MSEGAGGGVLSIGRTKATLAIAVALLGARASEACELSPQWRSAEAKLVSAFIAKGDIAGAQNARTFIINQACGYNLPLPAPAYTAAAPTYTSPPRTTECKMEQVPFAITPTWQMTCR